MTKGEPITELHAQKKISKCPISYGRAHERSTAPFRAREYNEGFGLNTTEKYVPRSVMDESFAEQCKHPEDDSGPHHDGNAL